MTNSSASKFCTACGKGLIDTAVICPGCGSPTKEFVQHPGQRQIVTPQPYNPMAKSKTTAVILAVFLGVWSYLYTYREDANIFWISIVTPVATSFALIVFASGRIQGSHLLMGLLVSVVFSVVAIIRQAVRPSSWFAEYPNS